MLTQNTLPHPFTVLLYIRDAKIAKGAERQVLQTIVMRADKDKEYSCFPSYELLAEDSNLNIKSVKRATKSLEKANLIKRRVRHNQSNIFYLNVALIQQLAADRRAERKAEQAARAAAEFEGFTLPTSVQRVETDDEVNSYVGSSLEIEERL